MFKQKNYFLLVILLCFGLTACATQEQKLIEAGAKRLDRNQVLAYIVGNTEVWSKGGGHYMADGKMEAIWAGKTSSRTYSVSDDGEVCSKFERLFCHFYMDNHGPIIMITEGKNVGVRKMLPGNQLSNL